MNILLLALSALNIVLGLKHVNDKKWSSASFSFFAAIFCAAIGMYGILNGKL